MSKIDENFALMNPITKASGKLREDLTREDLIRIILEKQLERITFHYTGLDGKIKELKIPIANRRQAELVLTEGERVDGSSLFKGMVDAGKSDLYVVPLYKSAFFNPFDECSLDFICRFFDGSGNLASFPPDNILQRANSLLESSSGLKFNALGELEFYLIGKHENQIYSLPAQKGYHSSSPFTKSGPIINEMLRYITQISGKVKYAHSEVGYIESLESEFESLKGNSAEQVEIEFLPMPVEECADNIVIAGWIIRNVAYRHGFLATFFPKIDIGHAGTGLHFHTELMKEGENIMNDSSGQLSNEAKMLIGGLCKYASSLTAFGNMVSASYLRLVPHQEAPTKVCWSESNRSALIRVPLAWSNISNLTKKINPQQKEDLKEFNCRQTVELRSPDGSANIHLLLAGITMAAQWGLTNEKEALEIADKSHVQVNIHSEDTENLDELATSCVESSEKLIENRQYYERENIFPERVIDNIASFLQNENDRNLNKRLMAMPENDKMYQSRRIMHRDLHKH